MVIPRTTEPKDFFLFSDMKLYAATHVYFICERIVLIVLAYLIAETERQYLLSVKVFFWLMVADLIDYCLTYNGVWFKLGSVPVSMNTVSASLFGLIIFYEWNHLRNTGRL
jgi:hypothetical protein